MKYTQTLCAVVSKKTLAAGIYDIVLHCPEVAEAAKCGQFINISAEGYFLRRPISICGIDRDNGNIRIVFEIRGKGTRALADINTGSTMDIVAPLGHGFELLSADKKAVIIGGGIGTPPLVPIAEHYGNNAVVITGFRNASAVILQQDYKRTGAKVHLCTDDGTAGRKGFVTDAFDEVLENGKPDIVYACGPMVMLRRIAEKCLSLGIRCQISLEERMGCGVGACLGCACVTHKDGTERYAHVCKDGPVFEAEEVF
ncbi:MAG: dihydroorotate dehydrogenase electron transfer subunit [Oscillospiraceae bacterium]|nr:dihydroorotate dehydrogenase electron transfer subunit [Oscillospiraceae bacterium]